LIRPVVIGLKDYAAFGNGTIPIGLAGISRLPPRGGSVFRIVDFPLETTQMRNLDPATMHHSLGDGAPKRGLPSRHRAMHRTRTADYAVVMAGEIDMLLDDCEIHLKAGDVLVQRGTNHAWSNRNDQPATLAFVRGLRRAPVTDAFMAGPAHPLPA
jgi:mannose-6-phosphate isomerase-like protein (cupin superfamily)